MSPRPHSYLRYMSKLPGIRIDVGQDTRGVHVTDEAGYPVLEVDGVVQSVHPDAAAEAYWAAMLPEVRPRRALILGFGGGTLAHLLVRRFGEISIVGVDLSREVLAAGLTAFGPPPPGVQLVVADGLQFVEGCTGWFDYVAVDLFVGGEAPRGAFQRTFLEDVRAALTLHGVAVFNLFREDTTNRRVARVQSVFRNVRSVPVAGNLVLHCRR